MSLLLSKTYLLAQAQCPRHLWLSLHRPEVADQAEQSKEAMYGHLAGAAARHALGEHSWVRRAHHSDQVTAATLAQLQEPAPAFVEVPLITPDLGLYARADALLREGDVFVLRETKASKLPAKSPDPEHLLDAAIQAWVFEQAGVPLARVELNYLAPDFQLKQDRGLEELGDWTRDAFAQVDVTEKVRALQPQVIQLYQQAQATAAITEMVEATPGCHCKKPRECPFKAHCEALHKQIDPKPALTLLPDLAGKNAAKKLAEQGCVSLDEVPAEALRAVSGDRFALYHRIQQAHITGAQQLDREAAQAIQDIPYPRYYFDFEGIDLPLPVWTNVGGYTQVPFQWSCHIERTPGAPLEHVEFLDVSGDDPSAGCLAAMRELFGPQFQGSIVVYFATYERGRMQYLAERFPEHAQEIQSWISQLVDLLPLVKNCFYHPAQEGSFSIKKVLPVLAPEMDYGRLQDVQNGTEAQVAYIEAALRQNLHKSQSHQLVRNMKTYCGQDTLAMKVVVDRLVQLSISWPADP